MFVTVLVFYSNETHNGEAQTFVRRLGTICMEKIGSARSEV